MNVVQGGIFLTRGYEWGSGIPTPERDGIVEWILQLPGWLAGDASAANLDVASLEGAPGFYRLRVGRYRAIFQRLGMDILLHGVETRGAVYAPHRLRSLRFARDRSGLRLLAAPVERESEPGTSQHRRALVHRAERPVQQNPLTVFRDTELAQLGLTENAIDAIRRIPEHLSPDAVLAPLELDPDLTAAVVELWGNPAPHLAALSKGRSLSIEALALPEGEASARLRSRDSANSVRRLTSEAELASILERPIEDWMVFLHPAQQRMVELSNDGPVRIRGGAGTGKTVVALHRARRLATTENGRVLLTTFVTTLPKAWQGLFESFAPDVKGRIDIRTVDAIAYDIYRAGGGWAEPAEESWRDAVVRDIHGDQPEVLGGLSSLGLQDEFDYVITGRGIHSIEEYLNLPRTGRGSPLGERARREVWRRYELYRTRLDDEAKYGWHEIRAEALQMVTAGEVRRRYASVIADETQDLTETSVRLLVALAGGSPRPAVTFVGDGQQSIYPGGFSLRSLGVEVRGRSFLLRTNWRNTYAIWLSASAFIADEQFDDLEEELDERPPADQPYPLRDGIPPRLHQLDTFDEASEWLAELVADDLEAGADPGDCAVLTPTNALAARLEGALTRAGVTARGLDRYAGEHSDSVWVGTFHRAKGLEFKHVYVLGLEAANWPPRVPGLEPRAQSEADGRAVRAAFVGMTRARDSLDVVTTQEPAARLAEAAWAFDR
jgi:hypothetical protein